MSWASAKAPVDWNAAQRRRARLDQELARIRTLLPRLGVQRAILFGSLARGDVSSASDLDLIVIVESDEPFTDRCARFYQALEPAVGLDLLVYTPAEFQAMRERSFLRAALKPSRVVYEA